LNSEINIENKNVEEEKNILSATIYIKNMSMFAKMNSVWDNWVEEGFAPARACVEANMADENILVEVSIVAAV
jgi:enamine deaminase RidA (YjgF/YER057c/UK114 family)